MDNNLRIFKFEDEQPVPDQFFDYTQNSALPDGSRAIPLVIDNGSYKCRVGWATDDKPRMVFKNLTARQRTKKPNDAGIVIGNDLGNLEVFRWQLKSPFDRNVVTQFDVQEQIFDYVFSHLGVNTDACVPHPLVITEAVCNPGYNREKMSELLFECYRVPSVLYGIDGLFSLHANHPGVADALVISLGYNSTHVLPVLDGRLVATKCRRLNTAGSTVDAFMQRVLQLKYPGHLAALTLSRAEELVQKQCRIAVEFESELSRWVDDEFYNQHVYKIQLPYNQQAAASVSAEQQKGRRELVARRLKEMNLKRRQEKFALEQDRLQALLAVHEMIKDIEDDDDENIQKALEDVGLVSVDDLQDAIDKFNVSIQRMREKIMASDNESISVVDVGDDQTSKEELTTRRQLKSNKTEPPSKKLKTDKKLDIDRVPLETDKLAMEAWLEGMRKQRQDILNAQADRRQRRLEMTKRRTQASQHRMKLLTELAQNAKRKKEDTFGMNEDDWNVYKDINKDGGDSDSETEADKLDELESYLREYDPQFNNANKPDVVFDIAEYYRLHIALEQIRTPELLFQPGMLGIDQAGLAETVEFVLSKFPAEEQQRLIQNVFVTGGCAMFPNMVERLSKELEEMRPFQSTFNVTKAADPVLDAWHGAKKWALSNDLETLSVTLADYQEKGGEYLKEHSVSNRYIQVPTPAVTFS